MESQNIRQMRLDKLVETYKKACNMAEQGDITSEFIEGMRCVIVDLLSLEEERVFYEKVRGIYGIRGENNV